MRTVWMLAASSLVQMLASYLYRPMPGVNAATTAGNSLTAEGTQDRNVPVSTAISDNASTEPVTAVSTAPQRIYNTGLISASEYMWIWELQLWFMYILEPLALVLLVLSAVAFLKDYRLASNCYLAAVCLFEAWYMLVLFIYHLCRQQPECWMSLTYVHFFIWSVPYTGVAARRCVYILNALVSFQRYIAVAFPFKVRRLRFLERPRVPLLLVFLLSFLLHLYRPLQYTPVLIQDGGQEAERWTQGFSSLFQDHKQTFVVLTDVAKYLTVYIPMLSCLVTNCLMIRALGRHNKSLSHIGVAGAHQAQDAAQNKKKKITGARLAERQMTVTILTSTFLMIFLNTPININEAVSLYSDDYGLFQKDHYLFLVVRRSSSIVSQLCDILAVLAFLILSTAFRRRFLALLCPLRRNAGLGSSVHTSGILVTSATAVRSITHISN